jgi:hypothetical protein
MKRPASRRATIALALAAAFGGTLVLQGCGGGGGGGDSDSPAETAPVATRTLTGVVATGLPAVGVPVSIVDASGATRSATTSATGAFTADVTGLKGPFAASAVLADGSTLVSVLPALSGDSGRINVTPLTTAVAARLAGGDPSSLLSPAALGAAATQAKVDAAVGELRAALSGQLTAAGLDAATFDPITTPFAADGTGADKLLDRVAVTVTGGTVALADRFASPDAPAGVTLAGPVGSAAPVLATAASDGPSGPALDAFRAKMQACLDVPLAARATSDASGGITGVAPACAAAADATYRQNGYTFGQRYAQLLQRPEFDVAKVGVPSVLFIEDAKAVVRFPVTTNSGIPVDFAEVLEKKGADWVAVGNQRKYDAAVEFRGLRSIPVNAANAAPGVDRIRLLLLFNPSGPDGADVAVVRITGPGLPAAGVVLSRSRTCGARGFMAIIRKDGNPLNTAGTGRAAWSTNGTTPNWELGFAAPTSAYTWPGSATNYRGTPLADADIAATLPRYGRYTFEVFRFVSSGPVGTPDESFVVRLAGEPFGAGAVAGMSRPSLSAETIAAALTPGGTSAGTVSSLPLSWTVPAGAPEVFQTGVFAQSALPGGAVTDLTSRRVSYNETIPTRGATSATLTFDDEGLKPGTADTPFLASFSGSTNPYCVPGTLATLDGSASAYREVSLAQRLPSGARLDTVWFRQNP